MKSNNKKKCLKNAKRIQKPECCEYNPSGNKSDSLKKIEKQINPEGMKGFNVDFPS